MIPDDAGKNEMNLRETIEEAPKARRNLNIKLIHQRKGRLLKHRVTQESPLSINKRDSSETAEVLPAFGGEGRKTRERDSKMRFSYNMPQLTKAMNPDLRLSVKDLTSSRCNVLHEFENQNKSSNYNSCLNSQRSLSIADTFSQSKKQNGSKINLEDQSTASRNAGQQPDSIRKQMNDTFSQMDWKKMQQFKDSQKQKSDKEIGGFANLARSQILLKNAK